MISLEEFKKSLDKELVEKLSEEQILKLRDHQDQMADIFFSMWVNKIKKDKIEV